MNAPDVVVIGGGPAGLAAAIACASHGLSVTLFERGSFPVDKPCGEGLLPNAIAALGRLGLDLGQLATRGHRISGVRYVSAKGRLAAASFTEGAALGLRRTELSTSLLARARDLPSLEIRTGVKAALVIDAGRPQVRAHGDTFRPKLIIGADGLQSPSRTAACIVSRRGAGQRWGCRQHFERAPWTDMVEVYFGHGFEVYVTPVASSVNVAVLWDANLIRLGPSCSPVPALVTRIPALAQRLQGHRPTDRPRARGPFDVRVPQPWRSGVLLIGDAAGYVDPLTGEGVGLALEQAARLADSVIPALQRTPANAIVASAALADYSRVVRQHARSHRHLTHLLLRIAHHPTLIEATISALSSSPAAFAHLLDVSMGRRPLWRVPGLSRKAST